MKNQFFLLFSGIYCISIAFGQPNDLVSNTNTNKQTAILWQKVIEENLPGSGKQKIIGFHNAQFDFNSHFFPIYTQSVSLPKNTVSIDVKLIEPVFEPISEQEKQAIDSYSSPIKNVIGYEIVPEVVMAVSKKSPLAFVQFIPIRKNSSTGNYEKLVSFSLQLRPVINPNKENITNISRTYAPNSVLATGEWKKLAVINDGIYKMDYSLLKKMGVKVDSINPKNIRIYGSGGGQVPFGNATTRPDDLQQNAIFVFGENDGRFDSTDYILFYGQSQHRWKYNNLDKRYHHSLNIYSDTTFYFFTPDLGSGKRIAAQASSLLPPTNTVTTFDDYTFHELDAVNLLKSGREWLGETFDILTSYSFTFNFPNIDPSAKAYTKINVAARRDAPGTNFIWNTGGPSLSFIVPGVTTSNIYATYYQTVSDTTAFFSSSGIIPVTITKTSPTPAIGWLNYIEVNARRQLMMSGNELIFRDINSVGSGNVSQFIISNATSGLQVWDVTDPINVKLQQSTLSGNTLDFTLASDSLKEFIAFNGQSFPSPKFSGNVENQNLHAMRQSDLIIVTHPLFLTQATTLADLHRTKDSMTVSVATTEQVYNEFSSGAQDVSAIRDFVKMFYDRGSDVSPAPKYLLLFGRGSYSLKNTSNNTNFVPAYESGNSSDPINSYPSDDFYGMLDDNEGNWDVTCDVLDLGVGRIPVKSVSEATIVVDKIIRYTSVPGTIETGNSCSTDVCYGLGDWINTITFIADDEDGSDHLEQADLLALKIDSTYDNYNIDKIYLDAYQQVATPGGERYPDATESFMRRMDRGSLIVNYTGHGGELGWTHERFLEIYHINSWKNKCKLPLFFTATCEFSRWDDPGRTSAGELTLLNPDGGGIGLMSTTRVVYSGPNFTLNNYFYDFTFAPLPDGKMPRLGDLQMLTKNKMSPCAINHRNFSLLSDPALSLNYPEYSVATTNMYLGQTLSSPPALDTIVDTAKALSEVNVQGKVLDKNGNFLPNFNGIIYPTVYDKAAKITSLSNDGATVSPPIPFALQKNILFKGKASVTNGLFSFKFIVPKDIAYNFGLGRISYYAHNGYKDACGNFETFFIGGTDTTAAKDITGPLLKLYMNDEKFVYGGITNTDPKIFVLINDSIDSVQPCSGINTAGTSIGHDITAVLDGNNTRPIVLNDYYESDLNSYKRGSVRYPLSQLAEGNHNLTVKVWDVYNNSSSVYTEFVVAASAQLALKHVLNYPNPFTTKTSFFFEHNKCCTNMDVQIQVFTISGKLVKTIHQLVNMEGYRSDPIDWDGADDYGDRIGRGIYIYRLRVRAATGETSEQFEKLVILK